MDENQLWNLSTERILRKYLWRYDRKQWFWLALNGFMARTRFITALAVFSTVILVSSGIVADGKIDREFISEKIRYLSATLPLMEEAYREVDRLGSSISNAAYKDLDVSFIYAFLISKWARKYNLDPLEVAAVALTESGFNHKAVSHKGARGLMQVHKASWHMNDYFDTEENIKKGAKILFMYKRQGPDYLTKYSGGAKKYKEKVQRNKYFLTGLLVK